MHPADFAAHSKSPWLGRAHTVCRYFRLFRLLFAVASASSAYRLPCFPSTRRLTAAAAAIVPRSPPSTGYPRRLRPEPSLPPRPDITDTRTPPTPHPLLSDAEGCLFGVGFSHVAITSRCRARLTLRSPPTRTRRALFGRHAAADGLRRIISSLAGCSSHGWCELDIFILLE